MRSPVGHPRTTRWMVLAAIGGLWVLTLQVHALAAETAEPSATSTTLIILRLDSNDPVEVRTEFQAQPPVLTLNFPGQRVVGSLPEHFTLQEGAVQAITTRYLSSVGVQGQRFIRSLQIALGGPYAYRVRSERGRIIVELNHPASVSSRTMEVGLKGGTIIGGLEQRQLSQRFLAMQNALNEATAIRRPSSQIVPEPSGPSKTITPPETRAGLTGAATPKTTTAVKIVRPPRPAQTTAEVPLLAWGGIALLAIAGGGLWWVSRQEWVKAILQRTASSDTSGRLPSGVALIDELVWQAFERQGYQLVKAVELTRPLGTLRVMTKEGTKSALLFVWNGLFFEKRTVDQFVNAMRDVKIEVGFLVASGSFTVPAQRIAKEHHVTLIGREQLMELLSAGATSEFFTKQLEHAQARLEEAKETLGQYANQLDTLRRQRNEASWYLGEERAKSVQLEAQMTELGIQLRHYGADIQRWQQEAATLRKQWDESQWYLGEAGARLTHLETQLGALQELAQRVEPAERARDEANWYLGEERVKRQAVEAKLAELEQALEESAARERALQQALEQLKQELGAIRIYGERRRGIRKRIQQALVELCNGKGEEGAIVAGILRDLSSTGVGLETDKEIPAKRSIRLRFNLPGFGEPLESKARVVWQQVGSSPSRYQSGCQLLDVPEMTRTFIEQVVKQAP